MDGEVDFDQIRNSFRKWSLSTEHNDPRREEVLGSSLVCIDSVWRRRKLLELKACRKSGFEFGDSHFFLRKWSQRSVVMSMKSLVLLFLPICLLLCQCVSNGIGYTRGGSDAGGEAYLTVEAHSGRVVSRYNAIATRPVGSLSQVATAVVAFDWSTATGQSLSQQAIVPPNALSIGGVNPMGLQAGDQIPLRDALYSMLMGSDSISAQTVAVFVGNQLQIQRGRRSGSVESTFVDEMNQLAGSLGMRRTRFVDAHGNGRSTSTAEDLARLSIYAMRHPGMAFYTEQKTRSIGYSRAGQSFSFRVSNTNNLVGQQGINGLKAGQTQLSGPCLIVSAERKPLVEKLADGQSRITPRRMIAVVLNSGQRDARALGLLQQGWAAYDQIQTQGAVAGTLPQDVLSVPSLR